LESGIFEDRFVEVHGNQVRRVGGTAPVAIADGCDWVGFGKQPSTIEQNAANFPKSILPSE
jgi:hypothetical protein